MGSGAERRKRSKRVERGSLHVGFPRLEFRLGVLSWLAAWVGLGALAVGSPEG